MEIIKQRNVGKCTFKLLTILTFSLLLVSNFNLSAQGPPITTETPIMLGLAGSGVRTFGRIDSREQSRNYVHVVAVPFNLSTTFQLGTILPFVWKSPDNSESVNGLGDITLFAKYQLYKADGKAKTFRILGKIAQILSTGQTNETTPIGSGTAQTYIGLIAGNISTKSGLYSDVGYNFNGNNRGDQIVYNFSAGVPLLEHQYPQKQINIFLELNGVYSIDPNSNLLFLSPGIQWIPARRLLLETSFQKPLSQVDSTNKSKFRWLLGLRFLI